MTGALGVHGYRSRNRWFYLGHIGLALFVVLTFFALFIHTIVQFKKMHSHIDSVDSSITSALEKSQQGTQTYSLV